MREDTGVVLASNRGPVSFVRADDGFITKRGAGGLAGALDPVARRLGERAVWVAAATSSDDREAVGEGHLDALEDRLGYALYLLNIDPTMYASYYDVVSNRMLWFALHRLLEEVGIGGFGKDELTAWRDAYIPVNEMFAAAVAEVADPSDLVLLQDYHLAVAPTLLRAARPRQPIAHFTHSAFCGPDGLEDLPRPIPATVIEGMLGADLLGFHVDKWCDGFLRCCERIGAQVDRVAGLVVHRDRRTWVRSYPIPIDTAAVRERGQAQAATRWGQRFLDAGPGSLVVRADRCEPSKNIVRGFHAFARLLGRRPDLVGQVRFVACLYPSRETMSEYRDYATLVQGAVEDVNERFPGAIDLYLSDDFDRTLGALSVYDALVVNPIADGMNLVSKEGACLNGRSGVLVLSAGAGSYDELGEDAVAITDPLDVDETAAAIEQALDMSDEDRKERAERLRITVESRNSEAWITAQLDDLEEVADGGEPLTPAPRPLRH